MSTKNKNTIKNGSAVADAIIYIVLALFSVIFFYPLYQVIICSFSDPSTVVAKNGLLFWPVGFQTDAYQIVFQNKNIWTGFRNTLLYMFLGTTFQYIVSLLASYTLSIKDLAGKKWIMIYFMIPSYFGGGLIPYFLLINQLGLMNSIWVLVIPYAINTYNIIIMRTHFNNLPDGLREAAIIDGAGDVTLLFKILLPLSGAVTAVLILYSVVMYWNMWYDPMLYLTKRSMYPLQSIMREILIDNSTVSRAGAGNVQTKLDHNPDKAAVSQLIKYANIVVTTVPILCVYPFAQKYFIKGVMIGSLKG